MSLLHLPAFVLHEWIPTHLQRHEILSSIFERSVYFPPLHPLAFFLCSLWCDPATGPPAFPLSNQLIFISFVLPILLRIFFLVRLWIEPSFTWGLTLKSPFLRLLMSLFPLWCLCIHSVSYVLNTVGSSLPATPDLCEPECNSRNKVATLSVGWAAGESGAA